MEFKELRKKTPQELHTILHEQKRAMMNLRFKKVSGTAEAKTLKLLSVARKVVARIKTLFNNKQLFEAGE